MTKGLHKSSYDVIWLKNNWEVPTENPNPNQNNKYIATAINIHIGHKKWNRGLAGCITVRPWGNNYPDGHN